MQKSLGSSRLVWFSSSYSNGAGGECVECALTADGALVRDSKNAEAQVIPIGGEAWRSFVRTMQSGGMTR
ncbi:DUF397 domain-containing protein [Streptomyces sp. NPDC006129]|uniref:DUF397 domain-containing protein n=1 Tax=unclassified Streptomyces TaxID=2593676 RepID=UPI0033AB7FA6